MTSVILSSVILSSVIFPPFSHLLSVILSSCQLSDILSCTVCHLFISYYYLPCQSVFILSSSFSICTHLANPLPAILLNLSFCQSSIFPVNLLSVIFPVNLTITCQSCLLMIIKLSKNI